ncbi:MAG: hypothetical protein FWJ93_00280 [Micromonosporaceae bacterium]
MSSTSPEPASPESAPLGRGRHPLTAVVSGMRVVDSAGEDIGRVDYVKMGDPQAVTIQGQQTGPDTLVEQLAEAVAGPEPDLPPSVAARLLRIGFFKIDSPGVGRDRYAAADEIADVTDDSVLLAVTGDRLARES